MLLESNRDDIERHLKLLIDPWHDTLDAKIEFRAIKKDDRPIWWFSDVDQDSIEAAVDKVVEQNEASNGRNIYVTINPIKATVGHSAKDEDIAAAYYVFADADKLDAVLRLKEASLKPSFFVSTGRVPEARAHAYWRFEGTTDLDTWKMLQKRIQAHFGTDAVTNPSRVLRLAGTITWPDKGKRARGYLPELTRLVEEF